MLVGCSNEMNSRSLRLFGIVGCCAGANIVNILTTMILFATSHRCLSLCSKQHTTIISRAHRNAINFRQNSGSPICTRSSSLFAPKLQTISKHTSCKSTTSPNNGAASFRQLHLKSGANLKGRNQGIVVPIRHPLSIGQIECWQIAAGEHDLNGKLHIVLFSKNFEQAVVPRATHTLRF